jgi:alkylation response protein AidB-like acyl-CoA dehydrogenase
MLYEWLNVDELARWPRYSEHSREGFDEFLNVARQVAERYFADHNSRADREPPRLEGGRVRILPEVESALKAFAAAGLTSATMDNALGGVQLPQIDRYVRPLAQGRFFATMCLSEPQAGSSLGDVTTLNIVHLVLARTPGSPPGTKGLSLSDPAGRSGT